MILIITQIIIVFINYYIATTENKKNIYIVTFLFNFANLLMYFFNDDKTTTITYIIIALRSLIYIYKDKLKTHIIPILFISLHLFIGFYNIKNIWELIPIIIPSLVCYYMWYSKNTQELRLWNAFCNACWSIYNLKTGLYIVMISRIITVIMNLSQYVKKNKIKKE